MGTMFGSRRTADFLSKGTWWLAGALAVLALVINLFFLPGQTTAEQRSVIQESRTNVPTSPTLPTRIQHKHLPGN
jgi:preprotein translocase subunit SecG